MRGAGRFFPERAVIETGGPSLGVLYIRFKQIFWMFSHIEYINIESGTSTEYL